MLPHNTKAMMCSNRDRSALVIVEEIDDQTLDVTYSTILYNFPMTFKLMMMIKYYCCWCF